MMLTVLSNCFKWRFASIGYIKPLQMMRERAQQLLKDLGCFHYANRAYTLSQGEKQRVMIARALWANRSYSF